MGHAKADIAIPETVEEARELLLSWGRQRKDVLDPVDAVAQYRWRTAPARHILDMEGWDVQDEVVSAILQQFVDASAELLEEMRLREPYDKACRLVGGVGEASKVMLEGAHGAS